jgi:hypothetical protein
MCESNGRAEQIQNAIAAFFECHIRITFIINEPAQSASTESASTPTPPKKSRRSELLNDPAVKTVLLGLDATVTGIEESD